MEFIAGNVWHVRKMRKECNAAGCQVIETSTKIFEEVAKQVVNIFF